VSSRPKIPEPLRALARTARRAEWSITRTGSGHLRWQHPDGKHVITPSTPHGGNRSIRNSRAELKRAGLTEETS
jgi:hypothetical protein